MYNGQAVSLKKIDSGLVELTFDLQGETVNKLNSLTLNELKESVSILLSANDVSGVLISSGKPAFIVGADITEFQDIFSLPSNELKAWIKGVHETFSDLENLPFPTVAAVNGMAFGGGFELALAADFRVMGAKAKVGLPEVNLGICPGWGGTVRLSRLIGLENSLKWTMTGKINDAQQAFDAGAVNLVVEDESLRTEALTLLLKAVKGEIDYTNNSVKKQRAIDKRLTKNESLIQLRDRFSEKLDPNYPAPAVILDTVLEHSSLAFHEALNVETDTFVALAKSDEAKSLVGVFMSDQQVKKAAKLWSEQTSKIEKAAVLGAGIMGGGVAYQSASTGTPILMKDINGEALDLGMKTASGLLDRKIKKGRMTDAGKAMIMDEISPVLDYSGFSDVDLVVEAVVENSDIKKLVLTEVEQKVSANTVVASNTSTISIDALASSLSRPQNFCGMHFFNPVHAMPLVEVIRGSQTSDETIASTVAYASNMGKTPIVVNDCPGFLVNRILFPYFNAFNRLLQDGVEFTRIDSVMEAFGWPMGPAYLADVIGIDTLVHADHVMQDGYPERMGHDAEVIAEVLLDNGFLGQKSGQGFYEYGVDESGRRYKQPASFVSKLLNGKAPNTQITDQEIIDRMMIPMCLEAVLCLDEGIANTAAEVDMGLVMGLGFPRFRGGPLRYIETQGLETFAEKVKSNKVQGALYQLPVSIVERLEANKTFY